MTDQRFKVWSRGGNDTAVVFIHGFIGDYRTTWGEFPHLLLEDRALSHCDVICWGYPSEFLSGWLRLPLIGHRLPKLGEIANALRTDLTLNPRIGGDYSDLLLVAHSMGGLVVQKMIVDCLIAPETHYDFLDRIQCGVFYATPSEGVQVNRLARSHPHLKALAASDESISVLKSEWVNRVYTTRATDRRTSGHAHIPSTVVAGLQDNTVPFNSVKSVYTRAETAPGTHTSIVKPDGREHTSFQILRREIVLHTVPELIRRPDQLIATNQSIISRANEIIYTTGSRSRDEVYLRAIEARLRANPRVVYQRVLMGDIRRQEMKDHLLRVLEFRSPTDRSEGHQTLFIGMYRDLGRQSEIFLCGNERRCVAILPPLDGVGKYSTGRVFTEHSHVNDYKHLVDELYQGSIKLMSVEDVQSLPVSLL